ncbi:MAG: inositol monophosphatase [bacterium]|nr:inositol monophosphatase [bacterium]
MKKIIEVALAAAQEAGEIQKKNLGKIIRVMYKGEVNVVTEVDHLCEKKITDRIRRSFPDHQILAEEGTTGAKDSPYKWIIDPLDATVNYAHGHPTFCVSIGVEKDGEIIYGVVYAPMLNELFTAEKGNGAFLNGKRIHVSKTPDLIHALVSTGFSYDLRENPGYDFENFYTISINCQGVRRDGCAALGLCYVAMGRYDGLWQSQLYPWDTAAGTLMITEAGGKVTDFKGKPFSIYQQEILATNGGKIHSEMMNLLKSRKK